MTISRYTGLALALLIATSALADLVVLYDSGQSWSIDRYLAPILPRHSDQAAIGAAPPEPQPGSFDIEALLPVRSPGLSVGPVASRRFDTPVPIAFFIIGSDATSLNWLTRQRDYLIAQGAIGLLVDVSDEEQLQAVATVAKGLPITPASGADIARALAIKHYPFAVTEGRIWQ